MAISTKYHLTLLYTGNSMSNPLTKDQVIHKLNATEPERAKQALVKFMQAYITPAFGSLPKREIDIALFQILQDLKIFDKNPEIYTLLSSLRVTRHKARGVLYEANLRRDSDSNLDDELFDLLKDPVFLKDNDKVCLEIGNPLLIDHLKHSLRKVKRITDGSFSPELVKLTPEAYIALINAKFARVSKKDIKQALIDCGAKKQINAKTLFLSVLKNIGTKILGDANDSAGEAIGDYLGGLITHASKNVTELVEEIINKTK
jgi:hypothetical protein